MSNANILGITTLNSNFVYKNFYKISVNEIKKINDIEYQVKNIYYTDSTSVIKNNNVILVTKTEDYFGTVKDKMKMLIKDVIVTIGDDKTDYQIALNVEMLPV